MSPLCGLGSRWTYRRERGEGQRRGRGRAGRNGLTSSCEGAEATGTVWCQAHRRMERASLPGSVPDADSGEREASPKSSWERRANVNPGENQILQLGNRGRRPSKTPGCAEKPHRARPRTGARLQKAGAGTWTARVLPVEGRDCPCGSSWHGLGPVGDRR